MSPMRNPLQADPPSDPPKEVPHGECRIRMMCDPILKGVESKGNFPKNEVGTTPKTHPAARASLGSTSGDMRKHGTSH